MPILRFEGYSDDTFGEWQHFCDDHDNYASGQPIDFLVYSPSTDEGVIVTGQHGRRLPHREHCISWHIGVAAYDPKYSDKPLPSWAMRFEPSKDTPYSPALIIDAPDGVVMQCLNRMDS